MKGPVDPAGTSDALNVNPLLHWDYSTMDLGVISGDFGEMRVHRNGTATNALIEVIEGNPLRSGGGKHLHTQITNTSDLNTYRTEHHPIGSLINDVQMDINLGGGNYASTNDWWYAFRMRIDNIVAGDELFGDMCQWHNQLPPRLSPINLEADRRGMRIGQYEITDSLGHIRYADFIGSDDVVGSNHKYIFQIRWDTRQTGSGAVGKIVLYLDDDPVAVQNITNIRTAHPNPNTTGRAPNFKYGCYKAFYASNFTAGRVVEQSYDGLIIVEDIGQVEDMRASIAELMDLLSHCVSDAVLCVSF